LQICGSNGQWGSPWACATGTCANGACTGSTTAGTSCEASGAGLTDCGPGGSGTESCCTSLEVPGGTYDRTYASTAGGATDVANPASVSGFRLDKYVVTVGRFRQYVDYLVGGGSPPANGAGKHSHVNSGQGVSDIATPGAYESGWDATDWNGDIATGAAAATLWSDNLAVCAPYSTWTPSAATQENLPLNCVDWYQAYAFCVWDGGFLPTEAEWEYAAAGGAQEGQYPWGETDPGPGNQYAIYGCYYGSSGTNACEGVMNLAPVGTAALGAGRWGQLDLAGEVWEWNLDWYSAYGSPCADCADTSSGSYRVIRGGSFSSVATDLLPPFRSNNSHPFDRVIGNGLRCARTP